MRDPLIGQPGYVLQRAATAASVDLNDRLAEIGLRQVDFAFLTLIDAEPGMTQSEAGRMLEIKSANMVAFASRHEQSGLLNREPADGRSLALTLTPNAKKKLDMANQIVAEFENDLIQNVPEHLRSMVLPILTALWNPSDQQQLTDGSE